MQYGELHGYPLYGLKATLLSWSAEAGLPKSDRRILGGHVKPGDRSVLDYSRAELAAPPESTR